MPNTYPRRKIAEDRDPWDQQHKEPPKAFHMFVHYRDLPVAIRTVRRAYQAHLADCRGMGGSMNPETKGNWSAEWGWVQRAAAWDREVDRQARLKIADDRVKAQQRHARIAQANLQVLSMPAHALLKATEDPAVLQRLIEECRKSPKAFVKMMDLASWSARGIPGLIEQERLALGLSTDLVQVEETHDDLGFNIPESPEAAQLAATLLDELARARPGAAERLGLSGDAERDRRSLGTGEAPALPDIEVTGS